MDHLVRDSRQDGWRDHPLKLKKVRYAIRQALQRDDKTVDAILEIVKNQGEY